MPRKTKAILAVAAAAFVALLVIFGHEPGFTDAPDTCSSQGIDPDTRNEGTCYVGGTKTVVVNRGHTLRLRTLGARLDGIKRRRTLVGTGSATPAKRVFVTFDLTVTNRTDAPEQVHADQFVLVLQRLYVEDTGAEARLEPRSFAAWRRAVPPGGSSHGTVTFQIPVRQAKVMSEEGNLDIANFTATEGDFEPEEVTEGDEVGVMRTYGDPVR